MESILPLVAVVFVVTNLMGMEDGLYDISDAAHPRLIDGLVEKALIVSQSNGNTKYELDLLARDEFPLPFDKIELVISNKTVPFDNSFGWEDNKRTLLAAVVTNREDALLLAGHYHTNVIDHYHPGHQMLTQFIPDKVVFSNKEPIMVKLRITNVGKSNFAFRQVGDHNRSRNIQFDFTAEKAGGKMLNALPGPTSFEGHMDFVSLKPGESLEVSVDLKRWFNFKETGIYWIRGNYGMSFCDPVSMKDPVIWEDWASAKFFIYFKK